MVSLNVAEHFGIDDIVGGISPCKCADIVIIPSITDVKPEAVISNGKIVAQAGDLLVQPRRHVYPDHLRNTIKIPRELDSVDFAVRVDSDIDEVTARVIDTGHDIANKEIQLVMPVVNGEVKADIDRDIIKVAAIDRIHHTGKMFTGFIRGFGLKRGAFAATTSWDAASVLVVGASEEDMSGAVKRIREMGGGSLVYADGKVIVDLPMPIVCQTSELSMEEIDRRMDRMQQAVTDLGCLIPYAHLMLVTLSTTIVPSIRVTTNGLLNIKTGQLVELFVD